MSNMGRKKAAKWKAVKWFQFNKSPLPSFFQIYLPELNSTKLLIPPAFTQKFCKSIPETTTLTNSRGRVWKGKLEAAADGRVYMTQGWKEFVSSYALVRGDFLVFKPLISASHFYVKVFGTNGVIKEASAAAQTPPPDNENSTEMKKFEFTKIYGPNSKYYLTMPKEMMDEFEYELPQDVMLHDNRGHAVVIKLRQNTDRVGFGGDETTKFWKKTNAKIGDKLMFEVILRGRKIQEIRLTITPK